MSKAQRDPVVLSDEERSVLAGWARRRKTSQALALRSRIVSRCTQGGTIGEIARQGPRQSQRVSCFGRYGPEYPVRLRGSDHPA